MRLSESHRHHSSCEEVLPDSIKYCCLRRHVYLTFHVHSMVSKPLCELRFDESFCDKAQHPISSPSSQWFIIQQGELKGPG